MRKLYNARRHGFRRDPARFRTQNFAATKISFRNPLGPPNRTKSHAAQHADARKRCWGPLTVVSKLRTTRWHGYWRDLARFRAKSFAALKIFGPKSAPNRTKSHAAQHADARNRCWGPLRVVRKLRTTRRHGFRRDLARFRTQFFAAAEF